MIGQQQIIDIRKTGKKPTAIFFHFGYEAPICKFDFEQPERSIAWKLFPLVIINPNEIELSHDLRFASGCQCHVDIKDSNSNSMVFLDSLVNAGASAVIAVCMKSGILMTYYGEWVAYAP